MDVTGSQPPPRRWVVTGASRGIGLAIARRALAAGDRVCLIARSDGIEDTAAGFGANAIGLAADITNAERIRQCCEAVAETWGGIDVLINSAGLHRGGKVGALAQDDWDASIATNLSGPLNTVRAALPHMHDGGAIVNVGAVVGFRGFPGDSAYGASKAGLAGLTNVLAAELARKQIRVNMVVPGFVMTDMTSGVSKKARDAIVAGIPLGRMGEAEEIAEVCYWVAGSTYMTGSTVFTDGGLMCSL
ncbi:SDR family NAD(P)-dependent oxidoreductase [Novosphingobium malaysiense]|uniref:Short-chain dehydrogenase n=1 Tax=Novosphingobium malaysiense TaxID=1348853 RepID=A0A0B1ZHF0_9SPHN|nr:SDR family NAD(P)-dependent oxidoreductase [Novosphingobium malaysiense]KHK88540.1 short-chain dehydrogenase [Novosphingobium malaysiense]